MNPAKSLSIAGAQNIINAVEGLTTLSDRIVRYMRLRNYELATGNGELNIVYLEDSDPIGSPIPEVLGSWNDRRIVFTFSADGTPYTILNEVATTEPGRSATFSAGAVRRGGVARIAIGQFKAWRLGYHKVSRNGRNHPALVQAAPLPVHRDADRNGLRTRDRIHLGLFGINQHSTMPGITPQVVGSWSEGCLVGRDWERHIEFIDLLRTDPRYIAAPNFLFTTTIIDTSDMARSLADLDAKGLFTSPDIEHYADTNT